MPLEAKEGQDGFGFLHPKKGRTGKQPHYTGGIQWNGEMLEVAAWAKTANSGVPYLSLKVQPQQDAEDAIAASIGGEAA